jgi:hypothetical protein
MRINVPMIPIPHMFMLGPTVSTQTVNGRDLIAVNPECVATNL